MGILNITKSNVHFTDIWVQTIYNNECNYYNTETLKKTSFLENLCGQLETVDIVMFHYLCWVICIIAHVLMSTDIRQFQHMICFGNEHYRIAFLLSHKANNLFAI